MKYGKGIMEYYLDLKMEEAKKLVSERELTFTRIAEQLCFGSIHYFSKIFKVKTGMSPRDYAKLVGGRKLL